MDSSGSVFAEGWVSGDGLLANTLIVNGQSSLGATTIAGDLNVNEVTVTIPAKLPSGVSVCAYDVSINQLCKEQGYIGGYVGSIIAGGSCYYFIPNVGWQPSGGPLGTAICKVTISDLTVSGSATVSGQSVCLADGTGCDNLCLADGSNCKAPAVPDLQAVTDSGFETTNFIEAYGFDDTGGGLGLMGALYGSTATFGGLVVFPNYSCSDVSTLSERI